MEATSDGNGNWSVLSDSGHTYNVTNNSCSCPHFQHRVRKSGGSCKHMIFIQNLMNSDGNYDEIIKFIKLKRIISYVDIEKKFGGLEVFEKLQALEKRGDIIYNKRKDTYSLLE
jgi:predicted nucleic acid-binding Zn finger protein